MGVVQVVYEAAQFQSGPHVNVDQFRWLRAANQALQNGRQPWRSTHPSAKRLQTKGQPSDSTAPFCCFSLSFARKSQASLNKPFTPAGPPITQSSKSSAYTPTNQRVRAACGNNAPDKKQDGE